jgi:hypothetical protein
MDYTDFFEMTDEIFWPPYRAIGNKKIEMAIINTLQWAARKNLIQMSFSLQW